VGERPSSTNLGGVFAMFVIIPVGAVVYAARRRRDATRARVRLHELSFQDSLTGLPNRRFLGDGFEEMLRTVRRYNGRVGVYFIDLDGFKKVNDTYGHEVGDKLMVAVTERFVGELGAEDRLVRYGGDEFVALCPEVTSTSSAERIAKRLLATVDEPFTIGSDQLRVTANVGVAHRGALQPTCRGAAAS
jgi:diguanylate cyclase (GGDEF)-like protein